MKDKRYKINEIFYSIQTEGRFSGYPAIFIRFSGCNKACSFCDTDHSCNYLFTKEEILNEIKDYTCNRIIFTGGEPLLQVDIELIEYFRDYQLHVETNGTIHSDLNFDWVTCSPKEDIIILRSCDELKVVYQGEDTKLDYDIKCQFKYLQPCWDGDINIVYETIDKLKSLEGWILSFQLQKIIDIE